MQVWRSDIIGTPIATLAANATTYTDTAVVTGGSYTYQVAAVNPSAANSPYYSATVTISLTGPAAPSGITASAAKVTASADQMTVRWTDNSTNESGFIIRYATNLAMTGATQVTVGPNTVTWSSGNLARGKTYYVQVQAYNGSGSSAWAPASPVSVVTP